MRKLVVFCEDSGHEAIVKAILERLVDKDAVRITVLSARHGKGRALTELKKYLCDIKKNLVEKPDAVVTAIDANCKGYNEKRKEIESKIPENLNHIEFIYAIPDPHVERWLLVDSHAFKNVFGKGCKAPNQKCEKDHYKKLLRNAIRQAGGTVILGGIEHTEELVKHFDFERIKGLDNSLGKFIDEIMDILKIWKLK
jgi:hypothetical protein